MPVKEPLFIDGRLLSKMTPDNAGCMPYIGQSFG
jgi:hypothetical protein